MTEQLQKLLDACTKKQRSFALAVTEVGGKGYQNSLQAAKIAGAEGSAAAMGVTGCRWLKNVNVQAVISCIEAGRQAKSEHTYEIAVDALNQVITNLSAKTIKGDIQANRTLIAAIAELDAISGLHKTEVKQTGQGLSITISERQSYPRQAKETG